MTNQIVAFTIGSIQVYAYGLIVAFAAALGFLWMHFTARYTGLPQDTAIRFGLWAIPLGLLGGRALFVSIRWSLVVNELGWQQIIKFWDGGFALFGVIPGCLLATFLCAKRMRVRTADLLDAAAPGAALALAVARFGEYFTLQGVGHLVDVPALQWFPIAMQNRYGDWMMPVFFWEGTAALIIALIAARTLSTGRRRPFDPACVFLLGLGVTQVLLESLRTDDIFRLGLVKVSQLAAMACVLAVVIWWMLPVIRSKKHSGAIAVYSLCFLGGTGLCAYLEYALDKTPVPNALLYLAMALTLSGMVLLGIRLRRLALNTSINQSADPREE